MTAGEDPPFADPAIARAYSQALGEMLVAFNDIDNEIDGILQRIVGRDELSPIVRKLWREPFVRKVELLQALSKTHQGLFDDAGLDGLQSLSGRRNHFAHGYLDQNPFDGSYDVHSSKEVSPGYRWSEDGSSDHSLEKLEKLTEDCRSAHFNLRIVQARMDFSQLETDE